MPFLATKLIWFVGRQIPLSFRIAILLLLLKFFYPIHFISPLSWGLSSRQKLNNCFTKQEYELGSF